MRVLVILLCAAGVVFGQDVYLGGRLDTEFSVNREARFDFGRLAGIDLTYSQPGVLDGYFDLSVAGGRVRVQEFYLSLPQTRRVADVVVGRFLLPYGDPITDPIDRYVAGGADLFDTYRAFRRGNVYLDTDVLGVWVRRTVAPVALDLVGASSPGADAPCFAARLVASKAGFRAGVSHFEGRDYLDAALRQTALHAGYEGYGLSAVGQWFVGRASNDDHRGWTARLGWRGERVPLEVFVSHTMANDDRLRPVNTTRLGLGWRFDDHYRFGVRYEFNDAPPPDHDDRFVARLLAVW